MGKRVAFEDEEAARIWTLWKEGATLISIACSVNRKPGTIHGFLSRFGGIAPRPGNRPKNALTLSEREEISRGIAAGLSGRAIAAELGRAPSTISREIARNGGRTAYRSVLAEPAADRKRKRPQKLLLETNGDLRSLVEAKLMEDWSPQQIAGWLRLHYPGEPARWVSESIYRAVYLHKRSGLSKECGQTLRSRRKFRRARCATTSGQTRGQIVDATPIAERPAEVESRATPGHWEGDLIAGRGNTWVATLVERATRYAVILGLTGKDAHTVCDKLHHWLLQLPAPLAQSLTWDRGTELARHHELTRHTGVPVYFCDPKSPWQRGTNENTNRLIRQYLPKGTPLDQVAQCRLDAIAQKLNTRPRKVIGYKTPQELFQVVLR